MIYKWIDKGLLAEIGLYSWKVKTYLIYLDERYIYEEIQRIKNRSR